MATVGSLISTFESWFPPELAEDWDAVGLLVGRRAQQIETVALAVDPTIETIRWARASNAQLLFVHHPLFLRGTTSIDGDSAKGDVVQTAIEAGLAIYVAHTNADIARPGVSDAIIEALGVQHSSPIRPHASDPRIGVGRVGKLEHPTTLGEFAARVAWSLPTTHAGVRWAGDPEHVITTVAVCGGAGDDLLPEVDADVYVTSDLRHHVASEYLATNRAALIDVSHAAAESMWLHPLSDRIAALGLVATVCPFISDPWAAHHP